MPGGMIPYMYTDKLFLYCGWHVPLNYLHIMYSGLNFLFSITYESVHCQNGPYLVNKSLE